MEMNPILKFLATDSLPTNSTGEVAQWITIGRLGRADGEVVKDRHGSSSGRDGDSAAAVVLTDVDHDELGGRREGDAALDVDLTLLDHVGRVDGLVAGDVEGLGDRGPLEPTALPEAGEIARADRSEPFQPGVIGLEDGELVSAGVRAGR
jgi:hypothetical protein